MKVLTYDYKAMETYLVPVGSPKAQLLLYKGYDKIYTKDGNEFYAHRNAVRLLLDNQCWYSAYAQIMALYPTRQRISRKLVLQTIQAINAGNLKLSVNNAKLSISRI